MVSPRTNTIILVLSGRIHRADIPRLCDRVRMCLERGHKQLVICEVSTVTPPDAVTVDALSQLQLVARRMGSRIALQHASGELEDLLDLTGLAGCLPTFRELPLEA